MMGGRERYQERKGKKDKGQTEKERKPKGNEKKRKPKGKEEGENGKG